jgi:hypothetical protein
VKLNNNIRCLIETLFNRVIDFNEQVVNGEATLKVEKKGVVLYLDTKITLAYWAREDQCLHIWAETKEDLEDMIQWLDKKLAIEQKDEIDPKAEAQRELDKEQI